jgi:hypothetical protein
MSKLRASSPPPPLYNQPIVTDGYSRCFSLDAHGLFNHTKKVLPSNVSIIQNAPIGLSMSTISNTPNPLHKANLDEVFAELKRVDRNGNNLKQQYLPLSEYNDSIITFNDADMAFLSGIFEWPRKPPSTITPYLGRFIAHDTHLNIRLGQFYTADRVTGKVVADLHQIDKIINRERFIQIPINDITLDYMLSDLITAISNKLKSGQRAIVVLNICNIIPKLPAGYSATSTHNTRRFSTMSVNPDLHNIAMREIASKIAKIDGRQTQPTGASVCDRITSFLGLCTPAHADTSGVKRSGSPQDISPIEKACRDAARIPEKERTHSINDFVRVNCNIDSLGDGPVSVTSTGALLNHRTGRTRLPNGGMKKRNYKTTRKKRWGIARRRYRRTHRARLI